MPEQTPDHASRPIVMVGLMGAGKSAIGRRLAARLGKPFFDADDEIERAAGCSIADVFEVYGEPAFRDVERRVIARLLELPDCVISTGGGAYIDPETREAIDRTAISVWLKADLDILAERTSRRSHRPLLKKGDPVETLSSLMDTRYPVYATADITVASEDCPVEKTVDKVEAALKRHLEEAGDEPAEAAGR